MLDILKFQIKIVQAAVSVVKTAVNSIINVSYAVTTALTKPKPVITNQTRARASAVYGAVTTPLKRGEGPKYIEKAYWEPRPKVCPTLVVVPTQYGREHAGEDTRYAFNQALLISGSNYDQKLYEQFACHAEAPGVWLAGNKESWNLDSGRPEVGQFLTNLLMCNPR